MQEAYAELAASPESGVTVVAPPWERTDRPGEEMREYLEQQVVRRLAADGLLEAERDGEDEPLRVRLAPGLDAADEGVLAAAIRAPAAPAPAGAARGGPRSRPRPGEGVPQASGGERRGAARLPGRDRRAAGTERGGEDDHLLHDGGADRAGRGTVRISGEDVTDVPMYRRARKGIGYLAQEPSIFRRLTVEENVLAILQMLRLPRAEQRRGWRMLLDELGIKHLRHSKAYALSGGERRRLEITRALVGQPKFMLLDEPFAGVDPIAVHDIQQIVADLRGRDIGVLISDHNVEQTLDIVDRAYIMYEGRVRVSGTVSELVWNDEVAEIYLGPTLTARMRQRYTHPE